MLTTLQDGFTVVQVCLKTTARCTHKPLQVLLSVIFPPGHAGYYEIPSVEVMGVKTHSPCSVQKCIQKFKQRLYKAQAVWVNQIKWIPSQSYNIFRTKFPLCVSTDCWADWSVSLQTVWSFTLSLGKLWNMEDWGFCHPSLPLKVP